MNYLKRRLWSFVSSSSYNPKRRLAYIFAATGIVSAAAFTPSIAVAKEVPHSAAKPANTVTDVVSSADSETATQEDKTVVSTENDSASSEKGDKASTTVPADEKKNEEAAADKEDNGRSEETKDETKESETNEPTDPKEDEKKDTLAGEYLISNVQTPSKVFDAKGASSQNGTKLIQYECTMGKNQKWTLTEEKDGYYSIGLSGTNKVLDIQYAIAKNNAYVNLWEKNGNDNQLWKLVKKDGAIAFLSKLNEKFALDLYFGNTGNVARVGLWEYTGSKNQLFNLYATKPEVAKSDHLEGDLFDLCPVSKQKSLAIKDTNGAPKIQVKGSAPIYAKHDASGYYRLIFSDTGRALSVDKGSVLPGAAIISEAASGSKAQLWSIKKLTSGAYSLINVASGLSLDVMYANIAVGSSLCSYTYRGALNQQFMLTSRKILVDSENYVLPEEGSYIFATTHVDMMALKPEAEKEGSLMRIANATSGKAQRFELKRVGDGPYYTIGLAGTNLNWDVFYATPKNGAELGLWRKTGADNQQFAFVKLDAGYALVSKMMPNLVLDVSGAGTKAGSKLILWQVSGNANQQFKLYNVKPSLDEATDVEENVYELVFNEGKFAVDVQYAAVKNGAKLVSWYSNGNTNQRFYLQKAKGTGYELVNLNSGMLLDLAGGNYLAGTGVLQWERNGGPNQKWILIDAKDGTYYLQNVATGLYLGYKGELGADTALVGVDKGSAKKLTLKLKQSQYWNNGIYTIDSYAQANKSLDVFGASMADGAKLGLWTKNSGDAQQFELEYLSAKGAYSIRNTSGRYLTFDTKTKNVVQKGGSKTELTDNYLWKPIWNGGFVSFANLAEHAVMSLENFKEGAALRLAKATGDALQQFILRPSSLIANGLYEIHSACAGKNLDVYTGADVAGTKLELWQDTDGTPQKFYLDVVGNSATIKYGVSKHNLLLAAEGQDAGAKVLLAAKKAGDQKQSWKIHVADGRRIIFSMGDTKLALSPTENGANIILAELNDEAKQSWTLEKTQIYLPKAMDQVPISVYAWMNKHYRQGRFGSKVNKIVIHYNDGNLSTWDCWNTWQYREASAHFQVESNGRIGQLVHLEDTAWHAGDWNANTSSIGIEHANVGGGYITEATLNSGTKLVAALCIDYGLGLPRWGVNVFPHHAFSPTSCPGQIDKAQSHAYISRAQYWYRVLGGK